MDDVQKRQAVERKLVRKLIRTMKQNGWTDVKVDDGEALETCKTEADVMEAVFAVEEANIYFKKDGKRHGVFIVLGNDGYDAIADWSFSDGDPDGFNALMEEVMQYANKLEEQDS